MTPDTDQTDGERVTLLESLRMTAAAEERFDACPECGNPFLHREEIRWFSP